MELTAINAALSFVEGKFKKAVGYLDIIELEESGRCGERTPSAQPSEDATGEEEDATAEGVENTPGKDATGTEGFEEWLKSASDAVSDSPTTLEEQNKDAGVLSTRAVEVV